MEQTMKKFKEILKRYTPQSFRYYYHIVISTVASIYYGFPERKLVLIGVTGTSGKSTTTNIVYHILRNSGFKAGMLSTVGAKIGDTFVDTGLHVTTLDPIDLKKFLGLMVKAGLTHAVVECSSHSLAQGRLGLLKFDYSIFTNIKSDHLDWHGTWEGYAKSKALLGLKTKKTGKIIVNRGDKNSYQFLSNYFKSKKRMDSVISYSIDEIQSIGEDQNGVAFKLANTEYYMPVLGLYNIENALGAITLANILDIDESSVVKALSTFKGLEGRMQIMLSSPFLAIVDYAHNTDSLVRSLHSARKLVKPGGRVICVFGSAGLRDVEKRYTMGETSAELADITIITSEDPRIEKLSDINSQIIQGAERKGGKLIKRFSNTKEYKTFLKDEIGWNDDFKGYVIQHGSVFAFDQETVDSRFDAIKFAIEIAKPGDVVITEGKGHEKSLCFGTIEYPFTDQEAVQKALNELKL